MLINLDPANETASFEWNINISELITVEDIMDELKLGPNGGLIYAIEFLEKNIDWLVARIQAFDFKASIKDEVIDAAPYFIFDLPG